MKLTRFAAAVLTVGLAVGLAVFAYLLDHLRATTRVLPGLGDAAEPGREESLAVPVESAEEEGSEGESVRQAIPVAPRPRSGLEVTLVDEKGRKVPFADVLAYRGEVLLRASAEMGSPRTLIPFDGPATLRVEHDSYELARLDVPDGHGSYRIVVPSLARVAGIVRVDGVPREGVRLELVTGSDGWLESWFAYGLETAGLHDRPGLRILQSEAGGRFEVEDLTPDWSGVLRLEAPEDYRFSNGARRIELARPDDALVLELEAIRPEFEIRGRVVSGDGPVRDALWDLGGGQWRSCDELGCFSIHVNPRDLEGSTLELCAPERGRRRIELAPGTHDVDLGDIELLPERTVPFVVRDESGAPIAGAVACSRIERHEPGPTRSWGPHSLPGGKPTDSLGRGVLEGVPSEASVQVAVRAQGYAPGTASLSPEAAGPFEIVLARAAAVEVLVEDASRRVPPGLVVRVTSRGRPFLWDNGFFASGDDEFTPWMMVGGGGNWQAGRVELGPDAHGRIWIEPLRAREPFDLELVDAYGTKLDARREIVLAGGEWRRIEFRVEAAPRTLIAVVHDTLGRPLSHAAVGLSPSGVPAQRTSLYTDRAGMVRSQPLYCNDVTLSVTRRGFEGRTLEHVAVPREGATVEIRLAHDWLRW